MRVSWFQSLELPAEQIKSLNQGLSPFIQGMDDQTTTTETITKPALKQSDFRQSVMPASEVACYNSTRVWVKVGAAGCKLAVGAILGEGAGSNGCW